MTTGKHIIGFELSAEGRNIIKSINPATGDKIADFFVATTNEVNRAAEKATAAFQIYRKKSGTEKAEFLEAIAEEIMEIGNELISVCCAESALPKGRIEGERGRTIGQIKLFANLLKEGSTRGLKLPILNVPRCPSPIFATCKYLLAPWLYLVQVTFRWPHPAHAATNWLMKQ